MKRLANWYRHFFIIGDCHSCCLFCKFFHQCKSFS